MTNDTKILQVSGVGSNGVANEDFVTYTVPNGELWYVDSFRLHLTTGGNSNYWDVGAGIIDVFGRNRDVDIYSVYSENAPYTHDAVIGDYAYPGETLWIGDDSRDENSTAVADIFLSARRIL